ncbi:DUF3265 domain-containing protein [Vibrio kanaloae]|nr:DUF3265 domain-containing protein [Vibrio kanaloae]
MVNSHITNASRRIRNAWHFHHAVILVIKVVCGNIVLRCSPLKRALVCKEQKSIYGLRSLFYVLAIHLLFPKDFFIEIGISRSPFSQVLYVSWV